MLKLMKYEFRKMRTILLIMLGALAALEIGFLVGIRFDKDDVTAISVGLISVLVFAVYVYILICGISSYSRELNDRTGYLVFMAPVRPISVVLSKLLFTILAALAVTALFGVAAWLDYAFLYRRLDIDPQTLQDIVFQLNIGLKAAFSDFGMNIDRLWLLVAWVAASALINLMQVICAAYLAITLAATALSQKKGFLRNLVSVVIFFALIFATGRLMDWISTAQGKVTTPGALGAAIALNLGVSLALCAAYAVGSAALLKRRVSL